MTIFEQLRAPFPAEVIQWRVGSTTQDKTRGLALPYIDSRAVQDRLDQVLGHDGWEVAFRPCERPGSRGWVCALSIRDRWTPQMVEDPTKEGVTSEHWLTREDGADESDTAPTKGAISDAFKRAAARFGVGRYLYDLDMQWVPIEKRGRSYVLAGDPPDLPAWALPDGGSSGGATSRGNQEVPPSTPSRASVKPSPEGEEDWWPEPDGAREPGTGPEEGPDWSQEEDPFDLHVSRDDVRPKAKPRKVATGTGRGSVSVPWQDPKHDENALCPVEDFTEAWADEKIGWGKKIIDGTPIADWSWQDVLDTGSLDHDAPSYLLWIIEGCEPPNKKEYREAHFSRVSKAKAVLLALAARGEGVF